MAIQEIVVAIDAYIDRLKAARKLLASTYTTTRRMERRPRKQRIEQNPQSSQLAVPAPSAPQVAVQIVPTRIPRRPKRSKRPEPEAFSALGGPIPKGPVVVRSSEITRTRPASGQADAKISEQQATQARGSLAELAQEVAKRLASGRTFLRRA